MARGLNQWTDIWESKCSEMLMIDSRRCTLSNSFKFFEAVCFKFFIAECWGRLWKWKQLLCSCWFHGICNCSQIKGLVLLISISKNWGVSHSSIMVFLYYAFFSKVSDWLVKLRGWVVLTWMSKVKCSWLGPLKG